MNIIWTLKNNPSVLEVKPRKWPNTLQSKINKHKPYPKLSSGLDSNAKNKNKNQNDMKSNLKPWARNEPIWVELALARLDSSRTRLTSPR